MERSAWPKNLSSSRKQAIQELFHGQNPTKKLADLFDAHSRTGNNTGQPPFAEHLVVNVLGSFSDTQSLSSSAESEEVLQVPTNACVRSEGSESLDTPLPRLDQNLIDDGQQWRTYYQDFYQPWVTRMYERGGHQNHGSAFQIYEGEADTLPRISSSDPPQLILDSPSPRDDSIPLSFDTSRIPEQGDRINTPLPNEDDLNPHGHSHGHGDNSNSNNQSTSAEYYAIFKSAEEISRDQGDVM
ncbi:hypothetical protein ACJRO7_000700 [Eucalyptus globulus]|uniref:Uncharacterized protein n=1 Tax=Eucalyptus globulus TaxID=34317 RepID=A0ABD3LNK1_EUCGL